MYQFNLIINQSSIGVKFSIDDHEYYKLGNKSAIDGQDLKVFFPYISVIVEILEKIGFYED